VNRDVSQDHLGPNGYLARRKDVL